MSTNTIFLLRPTIGIRPVVLVPPDAKLDQAYEAHRLYDLCVASRRVVERRKLWKDRISGGWQILLMSTPGWVLLRCVWCRRVFAQDTVL
ncbi:hypothetical protein GC425_02445 [Corynebacterium sp. zg254]|uniref:Uncharacterized protein n=1 Tax=Corynebacterium zhongnanshanii TaxID=2768834 RepID=A0ABQ6VFS8_9CORY|nr:hypothetical protein F8377_03180 [Corynebacterium zhongnanshanii]MCR5913730.1 hypothetical protein [Corynebacterium sp. zg254]